jgi:hypothetical protein
MGRHGEARQMLAELGGTSTAFTSATAASVYTALGDPARHSGYCSRLSIAGSRRRSWPSILHLTLCTWTLAGRS